MPLSKARNRERMRKLRQSCVQPKMIEVVQPKTFGYATKDIPKPAWMVKDGY